MKRTEISTGFASLRREMADLENPTLTRLVSGLVSLFADVVSENARRRREKQELKDEVNRLKGEQGNPDIKPKRRKTGNISSEQERKQAERVLQYCHEQEFIRLGICTPVCEYRRINTWDRPRRDGRWACLCPVSMPSWRT